MRGDQIWHFESLTQVLQATVASPPELSETVRRDRLRTPNSGAALDYRRSGSFQYGMCQQ